MQQQDPARHPLIVGKLPNCHLSRGLTSLLHTRTVPNDARLIALLLASKGIADADERVLHQLMDFAHREFATYGFHLDIPSERGSVWISGYTSEIVSDAALFAEHAGRSGRVDVADVELAVKTRSAWEFEEAAPKDVSRTLRCYRDNDLAN